MAASIPTTLPYWDREMATPILSYSLLREWGMATPLPKLKETRNDIKLCEYVSAFAS